MELRGSGKGREVLVTLNVERDTGRIFRSDQLRQQYSSEQAPQADPQLGARYLIADMEAQQLMESAGYGRIMPPPGAELVVPARGDLAPTGKPGSYRLDPATVQPGQPMNPGTRLTEERITARARELGTQGQSMSREELGSIVERAHSESGVAVPRSHPAAPQPGSRSEDDIEGMFVSEPNGVQPGSTREPGVAPGGPGAGRDGTPVPRLSKPPAPEPGVAPGANSQAGLASHRSGVPFNGVRNSRMSRGPADGAEHTPGEKKVPKRELPIPGMITAADVPAPAPEPELELAEDDGVVKAAVKGFDHGFKTESRRERFPELADTPEPQGPEHDAGLTR